MAIDIKTHSYDIARNTSGGRRKPAYIVLHYTATNGASAKNEIDYFGRNPAATNASADFFIDDSEIWQYNTQLDSRYSWAVGDGVYSNAAFSEKCFNSNQISIEMCCTLGRDGKWRISNAVYSKAVELTKYLTQKYGIPADRVIRHYDVSGKSCPGAIGWIPKFGETTWKKFKAAIAGTSTTVTANTTNTEKPKVNTPIYRVRKSANDATTQIGAYAVLANAKKQADAHTGYNVYDMNGKLVYSPATKKKTVTELAREVIAGKWGNGTERKTRLTAAGYDYAAVQAEVNRLLR